MNLSPTTGLKRRELLQALALSASAVAVPGALFAPSAAKKAARKRGRIDVHQQMKSPADPNASLIRNWTPETALGDMERQGVETAILSPVNAVRESIWTGTEKARAAVRENNEYGAKLVRDYPGRFGLYASLPFLDIDGSLQEIEYSYDTLKVDGVALWPDTGADRKWLGNRGFAPIFDELNRRNAVVFIHANTPACCHDLEPGIPDSMNEYDFNITRAVTSLLVNGTLSRCSEIKFIIAHSGATIPMLAGRIRDRMPQEAKSRIPNGTYYELRKLYYEIAHASFPWAMAALLKLAPMSQILFGTDYPVEKIQSTIDELAATILTAAELRAIDRDNAERLFPRLR